MPTAEGTVGGGRQEAAGAAAADEPVPTGAPAQLPRGRQVRTRSGPAPGATAAAHVSDPVGGSGVGAVGERLGRWIIQT